MLAHPRAFIILLLIAHQETERSDIEMQYKEKIKLMESMNKDVQEHLVTVTKADLRNPLNPVTDKNVLGAVSSEQLVRKGTEHNTKIEIEDGEEESLEAGAKA